MYSPLFICSAAASIFLLDEFRDRVEPKPMIERYHSLSPPFIMRRGFIVERYTVDE
jgi:hypothetical protein